VLVRFDDVASVIVNADHSIMRSAAMLRVTDSVRDGIRPAVPEPTEWQGIGNQIEAAFIAARAYSVMCALITFVAAICR
jgi:hypothetical protein